MQQPINMRNFIVMSWSVLYYITILHCFTKSVLFTLLHCTVLYSSLKTSTNDWPGGKRKFIMKIKAQHSTLRIAMEAVEPTHKFNK